MKLSTIVMQSSHFGCLLTSLMQTHSYAICQIHDYVYVKKNS